MLSVYMYTHHDDAGLHSIQIWNKRIYNSFAKKRINILWASGWKAAANTAITINHKACYRVGLSIMIITREDVCIGIFCSAGYNNLIGNTAMTNDI